MKAFVLLLLLPMLGVVSTLVRVTSLEVPPYASRFRNQTLRCSYDIGEEKLYSISWYHNDFKFFRYMPKEEPPIEILKIPGIEVIAEQSNNKLVVLKEVDLSATGQYKCEVISDWPEFGQDSRSSNMTVVVIPEEQPNIEGDVWRHYKVGDRVHLNCTAVPSTPPAALVWLINDEEAPNMYLRHYEHRKVEAGLQVSNLGLSFKLSKYDFINGELKLKCIATIATFYHRSDEHTQQDPTAAVNEVSERPPPDEGSLVTSTGTSVSDCMWTSPIQRLLGFYVMVILSLHLLW